MARKPGIPFSRIVSTLQHEVRKMGMAAVTEIAEQTRDPFRVLISCLLSLRTKDEVTSVASERLFQRASTPQEMVKLSEEEIRHLIYPVGFYKTKAKRIREICQTLLDQYDEKVPGSLEELLKLKGVGRKTANLVITLGFGQYGICVDTHVHRISNRLGWVKTKTPEQTEFALREILPKRYWIPLNDLLVTWGQKICKPISPLCSQCAIRRHCGRVGVTKSR